MAGSPPHRGLRGRLRARRARVGVACRVLALGAGAVLGYASAAALWRMVRGTAIIEVTVPTTAGHVKRDGIVVHRQPLPPAHVTVHQGIPVTTPVRTLLDLAAVAPLDALFKAFEHAQVHLHMPPAPLAAEVIARPRARGNGKLRKVLADAVDPADVRSVLELRFLRMCAVQGLPRPQVNVRIDEWMPDFYWPEWGLVVETDSVRSTAPPGRAIATRARTRRCEPAVSRSYASGGRRSSIDPPKPPAASTRVVSTAHTAVDVTFVA